MYVEGVVSQAINRFAEAHRVVVVCALVVGMSWYASLLQIAWIDEY